MYFRCPAQYYFRYVLGVPSKQDYPRLMGIGVHNMIARFHKEGNERNPYYYQTLDSALGGWTGNWFRMLEEYEDRIEGGREREKDFQYLNAGKTCLRTYWEQTFGKQPPLQVERPVHAVLGNFRLNGRPDQVREIPAQHLHRWRKDLVGSGRTLPAGYLPWVIIDVKTGFNNYNLSDKDESATIIELARDQFPLHEDLQATSYYYIFDHVYGGLPLAFVFYYVKEGKFFMTIRTREDFNTLEERLEHLRLNLDHESFPKNPDRYECKLCDYFKICRGDRDILLNIPVTEMDWVKDVSPQDYLTGKVDPVIQLKLGMKVPRISKKDREAVRAAAEAELTGDQSVLEIPAFKRKEEDETNKAES